MLMYMCACDVDLYPPHIVAGDNLNMPVVGSVLRHGGGLFIRRSFGEDPLYKVRATTCWFVHVHVHVHVHEASQQATKNTAHHTARHAFMYMYMHMHRLCSTNTLHVYSPTDTMSSVSSKVGYAMCGDGSCAVLCADDVALVTESSDLTCLRTAWPCDIR